jgi:hypothetical protein
LERRGDSSQSRQRGGLIGATSKRHGPCRSGVAGDLAAFVDDAAARNLHSLGVGTAVLFDNYPLGHAVGVRGGEVDPRARFLAIKFKVALFERDGPSLELVSTRLKSITTDMSTLVLSLRTVARSAQKV